MSPSEWVSHPPVWVAGASVVPGNDRLARILFTRSVRRRNFSAFPFLVSAPPETCALIASHARAFSGTTGFSPPMVLADQAPESIGFMRERDWLPERPVTFAGKRNFKMLFLGNDPSEHALFGEVEHWTQATVRPGLPDSVDEAPANLSADGKENPFSHSPAYGFLTSNPSFAGCGLQLECALHLPALNASRRIHAAQQALGVTGFELQPLSLRTPGISEAGFFRIVSRGGMKFPEDVLYRRFRIQIEAVLAGEEEALGKWSEREKNQLEDRWHLSLRLLQEAKMLDYPEFLSFASFARLGVYSGAFPAHLLLQLEALRVQTQPFHLLSSPGKNSEEETRVIRAGIVRSALSNPVSNV